jgi:hypothetical protein
MVAVHKNRLAGTLARQKISPQFFCHARKIQHQPARHQFTAQHPSS